MSKVSDNQHKPLIFDYSAKGKSAYSLPPDYLPQINFNAIKDADLFRTELPALPEVSEIDVVRHYTHLSTINYGVDTGFYPLGSCTMKYNPKINEDVARLEGFTQLNPHQDSDDLQGILQMLFDLERYLCKIFGFHSFSLHPCAGAQGEYASLLIMRAYHQDKGNHHKNVILIPDSAHGTNPASVTCVGWKVRTVKSKDGIVDLEHFKSQLDDDVAGIMLTNPNTMGQFESDITEIAEAVHGVDGLLYWDGANANAVMGYMQPTSVGFDICHLNLHKTFSTPHGSGGPGAGPVGVVEKLEQYLPGPQVAFKDGSYTIGLARKKSIGRFHSFFGNVGILLRAYTYIRSNGTTGLQNVTENAVLLANYVKHRLSEHYDIATQGICKHEFIITMKNEKKEHNIRALDVAKRLMDYGFHPPTIYFPINIPEAIMIETPESETLQTIDAFIDAMIAIKKEILENPDIVRNAPHGREVSRLDEVKAVKEPKIRFCCP